MREMVRQNRRWLRWCSRNGDGKRWGFAADYVDTAAFRELMPRLRKGRNNESRSDYDRFKTFFFFERTFVFATSRRTKKTICWVVYIIHHLKTLRVGRPGAQNGWLWSILCTAKYLGIWLPSPRLGHWNPWEALQWCECEENHCVLLCLEFRMPRYNDGTEWTSFIFCQSQAEPVPEIRIREHRTGYTLNRKRTNYSGKCYISN